LTDAEEEIHHSFPEPFLPVLPNSGDILNNSTTLSRTPPRKQTRKPIRRPRNIMEGK
jgi:hypothetical protein